MMFHSFCMCKKENDKEINEWYNEENWGMNRNLQMRDFMSWLEVNIKFSLFSKPKKMSMLY